MTTPAPVEDGAGGTVALQLLTGPDAGGLLGAALATAGGRLVRWRATQVDHRPGTSTTVAYAARVAWADGQREETLGASAGFPTDHDRPGVLVLSDGATQVALWRVPFDPGLPALAVAADPLGARGLLAEVGLLADDQLAHGRLVDAQLADDQLADDQLADGRLADNRLADDQLAVGRLADNQFADNQLSDGRLTDTPAGSGSRSAEDPPAAVQLRMRSYRPRRRAVIEARTARGTAFLKVVRPDRVADLHRRHRLLADAGVPVPVPLGWRSDGLLVLQALGGSGLRGVLRQAGPDAVGAADLRRVLDALPAALLDLPRKASWSDGARHYARVVGAALPSEAGRAADLADAVVAGLAGTDEPEVPVHGDYYEAQLLVRHAKVSGVLDVDSAGPGRRADDLGCLLAHAEVLAQIWPADAARLRGAVESWWPVFASDPFTSPEALRLRTAGVLLSLATGPHRVQQAGWEAATTARLDLVEQWLHGRAGAPRPV